MGLIMRVYPAHDSDLRAFVGAPRTLRVWLRYPHPVADVSLDETWRDLDALLGAQPDAPSPVPLRPQAADFTYPFVTEGGAHALSFSRTQALLRFIERIDRADVERFVRARDTTGTATAEVPSAGDPRVEDLLQHLTRLRLTLATAVGKGYGVLLALWDSRQSPAGEV
jgi:hypothetical protein